MKRKLQLSGIFMILLLVFTIGLKGTFDGYYGFIMKIKTIKTAVIYYFRRHCPIKTRQYIYFYTGFDTGYGFYAPNVASDFVMSFELKDQNGNILEQKKTRLILRTKRAE